MRVIHWFRSDLRIEDNTALAAACARGGELVPVFVLDDALLRGRREAHPRLRFLDGCLRDLSRALDAAGSRLVVMRGAPERRLPELARVCGASLVTWNRDYGPYAKRRDLAVRLALGRDGVEVREFKDRVVFEGDAIRTAKGAPYSVFTPYRRAWWRRYRAGPPERARVLGTLPPCPDLGSIGDAPAGSLDAPLDAPPGEPRGDPGEGASNGGSLAGSGRSPHPALAAAARADTTEIPLGGAASARARLDTFLDAAAPRYHVDRDFPAVAGTSRLSPQLRFGAVSVRACFRAGIALARDEPGAGEGVSKWLDELVWREFFHAVLDAHPRVLDGPFQSDFAALEWDTRPDRLEAWKAGMTGYPIVDAGMRELAATGWMHNRARMIAASFLAKDLHLDWRDGERWFMRRLVDGDPASNNGGWQWAASTGTDAQPFFRIFNPMSQGERFDPDGVYVRRWVPELAGLPGVSAHRPWDAPAASRGGYPSPIVDHARERAVALARYRAARADGGRADAGR